MPATYGAGHDDTGAQLPLAVQEVDRVPVTRSEEVSNHTRVTLIYYER